MKKKDLTIAVLVGGTSPEREVSKDSSKAISKAVKDLGYNLKLIDPAYGLNQPENENLFFGQEDYSELSNRNYVEAINSNLFDDVDLAFLGLHGKYGEDGTIQGLLELRGIKYTGAKVLSSALAMDKIASKILFQHFDVKTPKWFVVAHDENVKELIINKIKKLFGFPCIIKSHDQGSTFGLTVCKNENEVETGVQLALRYSGKALIEEYIPGREITVGILADKILPVLEIKPKHGLYDYECKYTDGMSEYIVPAEISKDVASHLQRQALLAYNSVECSNYGRVDFRLNENNESFCLEVNTLPGMTSHSLIPKMAKAVGTSFTELIDQIIKYELNG